MSDELYPKWIRISELERKPKTVVYEITTKHDPPIRLGLVKWFGRWRQYSFFPEAETIFDATCLTDIVDFLERLKYVRQKEVRAKKLLDSGVIKNE